MNFLKTSWKLTATDLYSDNVTIETAQTIDKMMKLREENEFVIIEIWKTRN